MSEVNGKGGRWQWPDPNNRSPNEPQIVMNREKILGLYVKKTGIEATNVTSTVKDAITEEAKSRGWDNVAFMVDQTTNIPFCVLTKNF
ncbi:hypothetical protein [Entomospira culicis]|uniref:Uncharacterized protein n=1 Tax=Entomospira culicis TaxID=2719989 RepID=A0A968GG54_9SPIO|nr:hypothetical protein [Entomospira culicis]NIZ19674.1 hypothetical protein [Entomospira culicis]NIZ69888.1 hypothetical protein [Entomospira culicis]WDI36993.1 hypothetical protein PVA46_06660 [Entomospira culicis]WDI38622.1 hypothetical protein PVA47_06670 [Entomospira culicis]